MSLAAAILGLAALVLVHEAGHFFVARAVGMRPRKFYVGFPPALARVRRNGIEYGIGAIPLGGYVKIPGMHRPAPVDVDRSFARAAAERRSLAPHLAELKRLFAAGELEPAHDVLRQVQELISAPGLSPAARREAERGLREISDALGADAYWRQSTPRKVAVIFAGPATNIVLAIALLAVVYGLGVPVAATRTVEAVLPGSPAARIGIQPGDAIVAIDGRRVAADEISATIRASDGGPLAVTVVRSGRSRTLGPVRPETVEGRYRLGFALAAEYRSYGPLDAVAEATTTTWEVTKRIGESLAALLVGEGRQDVSSVVGITDVSSQAVEEGAREYLQVLALISLSLALLNLLPLLPLDGGHITFSLIEGIRGRALGREVYERVSVVGIALVLFLFAIGLSNDISRLSGG